MESIVATQNLTFDVRKQQKEDEEMSTKIGKKKASGQSANLCPYEKTRMETIQSNAAKMKAKGFTRLENEGKLLENYDKVARGIVEDITRDEIDDEYQVSKKANSSRGKKKKQTLVQTSPVAELLASKSGDKQHINTRSLKNQPPQLAQESSSAMSIQSTQIIVPSPPEIQKKKVLADQKGKRPKYCAPGSMLRYLSMIKTQGSKEQHCNDLNLNDANANSSPIHEDCRPQLPTSQSDLNEVEVSEDADQNSVQETNALEVAHNYSNQAQVAHAPETVQNESNKNSMKKHRGKTILAHTHARTMDKRPIVVFNNLDQPVGPTEEIVKEFTQFLGTLAKDSAFAPLNYVSWKHMPFKTKIWEYVQKKFILENDAKKYVLQSVNEKWRLYKTRVKAKYYKEGETMEERMAKRPDDIPEDEFIELMTFWDSENAKEISRTNKRNREKQNDMHTLGPKSFALLREEMKQNDPNKQEPSEADVYIESRKRRPERKYLTQNEETLDNIEKMKALKTTQNESNQTDPYHDVITKKEHSGRVRMYGLGVTKASFKSKDPTTPYKIPSVFLDSIKQEMEKTIAEKMEKDVAEKVEKLVAEQVEQKLYQFLSKVREANQGKDLDIPDLTTIQEDGSSSHANSIGDHDNEYEGT